ANCGRDGGSWKSCAAEVACDDSAAATVSAAVRRERGLLCHLYRNAAEIVLHPTSHTLSVGVKTDHYFIRPTEWSWPQFSDRTPNSSSEDSTGHAPAVFQWRCPHAS